MRTTPARMMAGLRSLDKFNLTYAGKASQFEGRTTVPPGSSEIRLHVLAADQAGNFGQHILSFKK
jgi:hypothetical protein